MILAQGDAVRSYDTTVFPQTDLGGAVPSFECYKIVCIGPSEPNVPVACHHFLPDADNDAAARPTPADANKEADAPLLPTAPGTTAPVICNVAHAELEDQEIFEEV